MTAADKPLVIVGASYAGVQLAASARENGFDEPIFLVGDEPHAPYQRPPLSKGLLSGKTSADHLDLRGPDYFADNRIELLTGVRAQAIDRDTQQLVLGNGKRLAYGWLALATGARCRQLGVAGASLDGVFSLRTLEDALAVDEGARAARRVCVIGGGYIGLEVAASLRGRGLDVTVIVNNDRVLRRSMPAVMSAYVERAHRARGTDLRLGRQVRQLRSNDGGRVAAVELDDGAVVECDMVVLGIGVVPNAELAIQAGLSVTDGIDVDDCGRASAPNVLAAGDVASMQVRRLRGGAVGVRLESIQAANDGARAAASALVGRLQPNTAVPWFWSDQFDLKFQMAGLTLPGDIPVVRGEVSADRFSVYYLREGVLAAVHSVNKPADHMLARKLIAAGAVYSPAELADLSFDLKRRLVLEKVEPQ